MIGCENITTILEEPSHHNNTNAEYIIVGSVYMAISLFYLAPYVMCMTLIYTDKKLICKPYYMIVVNMGLTDIIQLVFNGVFAGMFTLWQDIYKIFWVNKFIGGLMNFCWVTYCCLAHALALNRFVNLFWPMQVNSVFSMRNTKILIAFVWIYGLSWFVAYMSPGFNLIYLRETFNWDYDENCSSRLGWLVELTNDVFHAAFMVVWYALIFVRLKTKKINTPSVSQPIRQNEYKKELKVLLQAFIICLMVIFTIVGFFCVPLVVDNKWATFASNLIWLGCAGNNAMVYYIFNSSIRKKASNVLRCKLIDNSISPVTGDVFYQTRIEVRQKQTDDENTIHTDSIKKESSTERRDSNRKVRFSISSSRRISVEPMR